ncbi:MAG: heavy metal translocating P-type ATPase [Ignisphaera sp.]|nr:heavy metal translocating P-type ATPase [Ignisphaera sp.]MCX8167422.1 heavy metal translocating P-type ATPase [Ignisphaera sp.]MDW8086089.1 heavy metal translocating P-type ATPase [Ignisphaera sp.]
MVGEVSEKFRVVGVDCPSCVYAIHRSLAKLGNIKDFKVDISSGEALIVYGDSVISSSDIYKAIRDAGYDVDKEVLILVTDVEAEEVSKLENAVKRLRGVLDCRVSTVAKSIKILYNPYSTTRNTIISEIRRIGLSVKEVGNEFLEQRAHDGKELILRLISFILGFTAVAYYTIGVLWFEPPLWNSKDLVLGFMSTIILLLNREIIVSGYRSLFRGTPTMDSLVAVSVSTTYVFSFIAVLKLLSINETFFEASAGVLGFIALGRYLEKRLRFRALQNLQKLLQLQQGKVRVVKGDKVEEVDVSEVSVGDVVEVKSGEKILIDGVVIDGWGYVDESTFTGESMPKPKTSKNRDHVLAGTVLASGYIKVRATRVGRETSLYYIYEAVREAQFNKPSFQSFADKVVGIFTWIVIALSIAAFAYWIAAESRLEMAVVSAAAVLAVACPCPLGIAIPMVVSIASIKAIQLGLLVRSGTLFEKILGVDVALFDKTGTITLGKPEVKSLHAFNGFSDNELLGYTCSVEKRSEHPLAKAILEYCKERNIEFREPENYEHIPGMGVIGSVHGKRVIVGSQKLLEEFGIDVSAAVDAIPQVDEGSYTAVYTAIDDRLAGIIEISDKPREEAIKTIQFLKGMGIKTVLASGDSINVAKSIAKIIGIDDVVAELRPEDKAELVEKIQKNGHKAMFVGDGVNDSLALSRAFIGIAMGSGADISKEAGDAVITNNRLDTIVKLYSLSVKVKRKALENLVWAFMYNMILIPIAVGLLYKPLGLILKPEFGAVAMILSDISVVLNSMTLLKMKT